MDTTDTTTPGTIGKYQVLKVLGRGGMGEVLLAEDDLGRRVAIKRPFATADAGGLARFMLEAKAATLTHPAIPVVYEMGTQENGLPFIAMEFVEGEPLDKLIASGKPMDLILKLSIIEQVCAGLGYAHAKGVVHRDIKPGNIMVTANGGAKIIDFGIAKMTTGEQSSNLTQHMGVIGTLHYIAPERLRGEALDGRSDIFSAGVMLYLLLTGNLPFSGGENTASYRIMSEAHAGLGVHIKDYPPALDGIVEQALAKDLQDRYATAEDFADALREVIEDLKKTKVGRLFDDAERLTMESRYDPALELLDEAMKLEPANTQVRKLRKMVREHQERRRRSERLKEYLVKADEHQASENYGEAIAQLKEAQRIDSSSTEVRDRLAFIEDKKRRYDAGAAALAEAEAARNRGDITAALRIAERAVAEDPENTKLLAVRGAIAKQLEREALQKKVVAVLDSARQELAAQNFPAMEALLTEAEALDSSHPQIEQMRGELARIREVEERRQLIEEIQRRVNDFLRSDSYDQAADLLTRAIEKLPSETTLHRLKMEVDAAARKYDSKQMVDRAITTAKHTFATDPQKALAGLHEAIEQMPGEERLIDYERSLRQQADALRAQQQLSDALRNAREFIAARQPDKAVTVLETYELEHGNQADIGELLKFARQELSEQQVRSISENTAAQARSLRNENPDEAIRVLEAALRDPAIRASGDTGLVRLLEDIREQQAAVAHKLDVVQKRAALLRERGQLDEAIQVLKEFLASGPKSAPAQELLNSLQAEWESKQVTAQAIAAAAQSSQQGKFPAAFEALQAVVRAYGESDELARATEQVKAIRSAYAQDAVSRSIETSRAALLRNDVPGAMAALRAANEMVEYADAAKQADWRRIGQAAKKAEAEPPAAGAVIADPLADLPEAETQKRTSPAVLYGGITVVCILLGVVGYMMTRKQPLPPIGPTDAQIRIAKAQPGAMVSIDGGPAKPTDATGALTVTVKPGIHHVEVTKDGYEPYNDTTEQLVAGSILNEPTPMVPQVAISKAGKLVMLGNLPVFKLMVDNTPRGMMKNDGTVTLEEGQHHIIYSNEDGTDHQEHVVTIAAGKSISDSFTLKAPVVVVVKQPPPPPPPKTPTTNAPAPGSLVVDTTPNAQVSIDGQLKGTADAAGNFRVPSLAAGNHSIDISLDKFQPLSGRSVTIAAGQPAHFGERLTALAPTTGSVTIQTTPQAQISIDGQPKGRADGSGQLNLDGIAPGQHTVEITLDHFQTFQDHISVRAGASIILPAKLTEVVVSKPATGGAKTEPDNSADIAGINEALHSFEQAFDSRNMGRIQATWSDIGASRSKQLADVMKTVTVVNIHESCEGQPSINGNTATLSCAESAQYGNNAAPFKSHVSIIFAKAGGKWVMKDKK